MDQVLLVRSNAFYHNTIFSEVVGGRSKKEHMHGLGQQGDEYLALSSSQSDIDTHIKTQREMITILNIKLASKDSNIEHM